MSNREKIEFDVYLDNITQEIQWSDSEKESALAQCIYLFTEGESEEVAFRILLEEGLGINFEKYGVVIANYKGNKNLKNTIRLMSLTLSHARPMIFTFDDDNASLISGIGQVSGNVHLFKVPHKPTVMLSSGQMGGSFEESFEANDFIDACFETTLLKMNPQISKHEFINFFDHNKLFHKQIEKFVHLKGIPSKPCKIEIAEYMASNCALVPQTYVKLAELIKDLRSNNPVKVKVKVKI